MKGERGGRGEWKGEGRKGRRMPHRPHTHVPAPSHFTPHFHTSHPHCPHHVGTSTPPVGTNKFSTPTRQSPAQTPSVMSRVPSRDSIPTKGGSGITPQRSTPSSLTRPTSALAAKGGGAGVSGGPWTGVSGGLRPTREEVAGSAKREAAVAKGEAGAEGCEVKSPRGLPKSPKGELPGSPKEGQLSKSPRGAATAVAAGEGS